MVTVGAIRILAFGDSLTEGILSNVGYAPMYPYANQLQLLVQAEYPTAQVDHSGISGERVLPSMQTRLEKELSQAQAQGIRYDWVLLLAGINDLCYEVDGATVFQGLMHMYQTANRFGARVMAMTCLENRGSVARAKYSIEIERERQGLNAHIREYCAKHQTGPQGAVLLDIDKLLPYVSLETEGRRLEFFSDGLHLTKKGYDTLAKLAFHALKPQMAREESNLMS